VIDTPDTEDTTPAPRDVVIQATSAIADSQRAGAEAAEELAAWDAILRAA
jgi:hypothetical protein